jgi:hypothetical protein
MLASRILKDQLDSADNKPKPEGEEDNAAKQKEEEASSTGVGTE